MMFCVLTMKCFAILLKEVLVGTTINKSYSVVPRVQPELRDAAGWLGRKAKHRCKSRRDPLEVGLRILLEAARGDDSPEVQVRRICGRQLGTGAEK